VIHIKHLSLGALFSRWKRLPCALSILGTLLAKVQLREASKPCPLFV
jgi:hypothetical protein